MTRQEFKKLAREEAEKYAESQLGHANPLMKVACAIDYRAGAHFGFDQGVEAILQILEGESGREAFRINTHSVAISILKRKLAEREGETK